MKIYFACSITGGRKDEENYQIIVRSLVKDGHHVLTEDLAEPEVMLLEKVIDPVEVYSRDTKWIRECEALVAEISTPSHGVGYEIGFALNLGKPVICLFENNAIVSKMILGNRDSNLSIFSYNTVDDAIRYLRNRLNGIHPD
jgi:nucleoside 2-deoxyribosyltransferase